MAAQSKPQQETIGRVMHEFKHHELETPAGDKVRDPKQAIAIALHEAGASNQESPKKNRETLKRTKAKERQGQTTRDAAEGPETRAALYAEARKRGIAGRSKMTKEVLRRALGR